MTSLYTGISPPPINHSFSNDWRKVITVTAKRGTGKTKCIHSCISYLVSNDRPCLVATPTGYLASKNRAKLDTIDCDTVHVAFSLPIDNFSPTVNWSLSRYAVIFLDFLPWANPILVMGKPGTRKTHAISETVSRVTEREG